MFRSIRRWRPTSAHVIALIALFVALCGSAYAFELGKNSVKSKNIAKGAVKTRNLAKGAVSAAKLKPGAVPSNVIADGSITGAKIAPGAIGARELGNVVVREASEPVPAGSNRIPEASCLPGEQALSGGAFGTASPGHLLSVRPLQPGGASTTEGSQLGAWQADVYDDAPSPGFAYAFAICLQ